MNSKHEHLVEGKYLFKDLVDIEKLQILFEKFSESNGLATGLISYPNLEILVSTKEQDICTKFHRVFPSSSGHCKVSNLELTSQPSEGEKLKIHHCITGLVDGVIPIIIRDVHVANLFTGQVLFEKPDVEQFKKQGDTFGYDVEAYIKALNKVPIVTEKKFKSVLGFLSEMAIILAEQGLTKLQNRAAAKALYESEEHYKALSDATFEAIFISKKGICIDANKSASEMFGFTYNELIGIFGTDVIAPESKELVKQNMLSGYEKLYEAVAIRKDGTTFPAEFHGRMFEIDGEEVKVTAVRDITEQKLSEEKMRYLNYGIEAAGEAIVMTDVEGTIEYVNPAFTKITGYTASEAVGKNPRIIKSGFHTKEFYKEMWSTILGGKVWHNELTNIRKDKALYKAELTIAPVFDQNGKVDGFVAIQSDISKRKQAEEALKESEEKFSAITEQSSEGIALSTPEGDYVFVNQAFCKMMGYSKDELLQMTVFDVKKDKSEKAKEGFKKSKSKKSGAIIEVELQRKDKSSFPSEITGKPIKIGDKDMVLGIVKDITERKQAEEALRKSRNKYQNLFEKSKDPILIIQDGKFVDCNDATVEMLKYNNKSDLLQTHPSQLSPEKQLDGRDSNEKADEMMKIAIEKGSNRFEWNHVRADGEIFPVEVLLTSITNEDGSQLIHTVWRDISERIKREKLQRALYDISEEASKADSIERFYKSLHQIIATLMPAKNFYVAIYNEDKIVFPYHIDEYDSPPPAQPFGNGLTEYVLKTRKSQIITEELDRELQKRGEVGLNGEYTKIWIGIYLEFEGDYKGVLVLQDYENENAYGDEDVKVLQFVSQQIVKAIDKIFAETRLQKSLKELSEAKEELEVINKNKDRFFSIIAHDLRSPFMALLGISQMITEDIDSMSVKEVKEMTGSIHRSTQNLFKMIENLLNWSRLQMGTYQINPKNFNIKEAASNVRLLLQLSAEKKKIQIENDTDETFVYADEDCVKTILRNLVNNAIKFTERGGKIKLSSKPRNNFIEITVEDNGVGINKNILERLFSITEKVSEVGTEKEIGTGLGLILCKELVEKNGGEIWVKSELSKGSKFTFSLPIENSI
ncbi:MAG: PAS domain S-box protein [Melioribacteraceae bacterium]|nr:PAS domain S-box protein [Melioribacteraceae bacterium]